MSIYARRDYDGTPEDLDRCAARVRGGSWVHPTMQCSRKRGHGEGGILCKQHAAKDLGLILGPPPPNSYGLRARVAWVKRVDQLVAEIGKLGVSLRSAREAIAEIDAEIGKAP